MPGPLVAEEAAITGSLPLKLGDVGEPVRDLHRRLARAGIEIGAADLATFDAATEAGVREFQDSRRLHNDGVVGAQTWAALDEAGYQLGDRLLYHMSPMLRGDDVASLQLALGTMGFDAGRVDGIFGPDTASALDEFQRNTGLVADAICGPETAAAIERLSGRGQPAAVAVVRERERLRQADLRLSERRVAVGHTGGLGSLASTISQVLRRAGAVVAALEHTDWSAQAAAVNEFDADLYIGLTLADDPHCEVSYFATTGFESAGGRRLAEVLVAKLPPRLGGTAGQATGRRIPILRETRAPAVLCRIGPPGAVVEGAAAVADVVAAATREWFAQPVD